MIGNELATIINDVCCNWLFSGQDQLCRSTFLRAELAESAKRNHIHVLIVPEDCMPFVSTILPTSGLVSHGHCPHTLLPIFQSSHPMHMRIAYLDSFNCLICAV